MEVCSFQLSSSRLSVADVLRELYHTSLLWQLLRVTKSLLIFPYAATCFHNAGYHDVLFPRLMRMHFSWGEERRAFFQFQRRQIVIELLYEYLNNVRNYNRDHPETTVQERAQTVLGYLRDFTEREKPMHDFIAAMYKQRRYKNWHKELRSTTAPWTGTPWMYWHKDNIIPIKPIPKEDRGHSYMDQHWPERRQELPCSDTRSHIETLVSLYLASNIDLMNAIIATLPTWEERRALRQELKDTGFEDLFAKLRTASQTNFPCITTSISTYCRAAIADGWSVRQVMAP